MNRVGGILNHLSHLTVNLIIENINTAKDVKSTCIYFRIACWLKCRLVDVLIEGSFIWIFAVLSWFSIFFFLICCGDLNFRLKINRGWNKVGRSFITNILSEVSWTRSIYLARVFCFLLSNENFIIWSSDHGVEEHVAHGFFTGDLMRNCRYRPLTDDTGPTNARAPICHAVNVFGRRHSSKWLGNK